MYKILIEHIFKFLYQKAYHCSASGCYVCQFWRVYPPRFCVASSKQQGPFAFLTCPSSRATACLLWWLLGLTHAPLPGFAFSFLFTGSVLFSSGNQTAPGCTQLSCWWYWGRDAVIVLAQPKCSWRSLLQGEHSKRERLVGKHSSDGNASGGHVITWERDKGCSDKIICVMSKL